MKNRLNRHSFLKGAGFTTLSATAISHGWPIVIEQLDNGLWDAQWELARIDTPELPDPVVQVRDEGDGEIVHTLRVRGTSFTPKVRKPRTYTVLAFDPDGDFKKVEIGVIANRIKRT